jgi:hypothetical protein
LKPLIFGDDVQAERKPPNHFEKAFQPLPGSTPVPLAELDRSQCKWPVGDNPTLFCALPSHTGRYCPTHERRSGKRLPAMDV